MRVPATLLGLVAAVWLFTGGLVRAADKNGVSPQTISLPTGPGSIQGLGESFQPQLNSGSGSHSVPIQLPLGPAGFGPTLALQYHTGNSNGLLGVGWKLSGLTMVSRNIDGGLPLYVDDVNGIDDDFDGAIDNPEEIDRFSGVDLEELLPVSDGTLRSESEASFLRYERTAAGWQARTKSGLLHEFGTVSSARIENGSRVFAWLLSRTTDLNGNQIEFRYEADPSSPGQKYCKEIRWAGSTAFYAAVLSYDASRPDVHSDYRSGFEVRTALRLARIDVIAQGVPTSLGALVGDLNQDGQPDSLIRRYELEYQSGTLQSLLRRVTQFGSDGVTQLPSATMEYTSWDPPDNVSALMTQSAGDPSVGLESANVELIDMNGDGLPDLLHATTAAHRVHLNLGMNDAGRLAWDTVGSLVGNAPNLDLKSSAVHLADHSADGESDLIHKVNISTFQCFLNSGQGSWMLPVNLRKTDSWPQWPFENAGSRTLDSDHNRLNDVLFTGDNGNRLWMMMPGGRYGREIPLPVLSDGTQAFRFEDPGARIADVNGDRISDLAWVKSDRVTYWASCGRGNFDGPHDLLLDGQLSVNEISQADFADINGDGLVDLVVFRPAVSPNGIHYRLNKGRAGFDALRTIIGLPAVECTGTPPNVVCDAVRWADMNGNGSVDMLISNGSRPLGTREQFLDFVPGVRPHLLRRFDNGLGLIISMNYEPSVEQMVRARDGGNPWTKTMPISVPVVSSITESDSRGNEYTREITYRDPHYDSVKQEFRGFGQAESREIGDASAPTKVVKYTFDTGELADCRKGMVLNEEVVDVAGARFERTDHSVQHRILDTSPDGRQLCFAFTEASDNLIFEKTDTPIHIRSEYQYDDFGNMLREDNFGVVGQTADEILVEKQFLYVPAIWLMDRAIRSTTRDGLGARVEEELSSYDSRGNLLEQRRWLNTEDRYIVAVRNDYDTFGNVIRTTDANDHSRSIAYDPLLNRHPISETVHLEERDLVISAEYDLVLGTLIRAVDFAGAPSTWEYDALGRVTMQERPGGARTTYAYQLGSPISQVSTRVLESLNSPDTFDRHDYFDGYGRKLGSKIEAEDGQWRFVDAVAYNRRKLEHLRWLPYFTSSHVHELPDVQEPHRVLEYDVQGRAVRATNPDATFSRTVYEPLVQHEHDENDTAGTAAPKTLRRDGLQRLVEVIERNGPNEAYHTHYAWNALGNLTSITDAQGNTKTMDFDSLQRSIALQDPDRGAMTYAYDDAGNLLRTTDARGQQILYAYDFANRLVSENYLDEGGGPDDPVDVRYHYDVVSGPVDFGDGHAGTPSFTGGRLSSVADLSGEEHRSYDARGNLIWTVKRIRDPQLDVLVNFKTGLTYDVMDRIAEVQYPDGDRCAYGYNTASFLETAGGGAGGQAMVTAAAYEPTGQVAQLTLGNGVSTSYEYDSRDRLAALRTDSPSAGELIHYAYTYDPVSNFTRIDDQRSPALVPPTSPRRNTQLFAYDGLHRLTQVKYSPQGDGTPSLGQIDYAYDKIGNMVSQSTPGSGQAGHIADPAVNLGAMTSGGAAGTQNRAGRLPGDPPGPHAISAAQSGGAYDYDDNGNMTGVDGATLTWDFKNRLVRFQKDGADARYVYDYVDRRVVKLVVKDKKAELTLYPDAGFEYRPNRDPIKYVFNGSTRLARVSGTIDPARQRLQRIWLFPGWNLLTIAVQSLQTAEDVFGAGSRAYEWTGKEYLPVPGDAFVPVGVPLWVEVNGGRVATAAGLYDPPSLPVAISSGQSLLAWPRLEPLVPDEHFLISDLRIQAHDAGRFAWLNSDSTLPPVISDMLTALPAAGAAWLDTAPGNLLLPGATDNRQVLFYHGDHLGSPQVMTGDAGIPFLETYYYPFGATRHSQQSGSLLSEPYGYTQKGQDTESGLHYFEVRYLNSALGRFATVDSKYANPGLLSSEELGSYLATPLKGHLYSYVMNNPIKYTDPTGHDESSVEITSVLEGINHAAEKTGVILEVTEHARAAQIARNLGTTVENVRHLSTFKATPTVQKFGAAVGIGLNIKEGVDFAKDPTLEKGAHLGGTTVITVGGFVSGPGAAIAGSAQYVYDTTPKIHTIANRAGDLERLRTGSRIAGGVEAAKVSVALTLVKLGAGVGGGQAGFQGADRFFDWLLD